MKLDEYSDLKEKSQLFHRQEGIFCKDLNDLFTRLEVLAEERRYMFRGINEAKYKLYNSAQRTYLLRGQLANNKEDIGPQEYYNSLIISILKSVKTWNSGSILRYLKSLDISENDDLAFLSYLQHYGFPTPLLDFTTDPFVALFFAAENVKFNSSNTISLNSAFSLYWIDIELDFNKVLALNEESVSDKKRLYSEILKSNAISIIKHDIKQYRVRNNPKILNQKGCFVFNWHSTNPLEVAYMNLVKDINDEYGKHGLGEISMEKMYCLNIHKCLAPAILDRLSRDKGINSSYIYPNLENHIKEITNKAFIDITY